MGIYIHNMYQFIERPDFCIFIEGSYESIFVEIEMTNGKKTHNIWSNI